MKYALFVILLGFSFGIQAQTELTVDETIDFEIELDHEKDSTSTLKIHTISKLVNTAPDESYGFSEKSPVKVGTGPNGGPANQRQYLELLRDAKGQRIKYERVASCCAYESENGLFGMAMVDRYEITYLNAKGKKCKTYVYLSFYDYEEPMILFGFTTIQ
jgi:hypothetical protein